MEGCRDRIYSVDHTTLFILQIKHLKFNSTQQKEAKIKGKE